MKVIKKLIKQYLKKRGLALYPYNEYYEKLEPVKNIWLKKEGINTVIDVGASTGGFAKKIRAVLPNAEIISFEPIQSSFEILRDNFIADSRHKAYLFAVADYKGETDFFLSDIPGTSSILTMGELHKQEYPSSAKGKWVTVPCDTLDNLVNAEMLNKKILLKTDVQGAEKMILNGAKMTMPFVDIVYTEISFQELYKGQVLVNEIICTMSELGFSVIGADDISRSLHDGAFLQGNLFFRKNNI